MGYMPLVLGVEGYIWEGYSRHWSWCLWWEGCDKDDDDDDVDVVFIFNLGLAPCLVPNLYSYLSVVLAPIFVSTIAFGCAPKLVSSFATIISPC